MQDKTPITIGNAWNDFTDAEKQEMIYLLNKRNATLPMIDISTLPFVPVNDCIKCLIGIGAPLSRKLLALKTGHYDKLKRIG